MAVQSRSARRAAMSAMTSVSPDAQAPQLAERIRRNGPEARRERPCYAVRDRRDTGAGLPAPRRRVASRTGGAAIGVGGLAVARSADRERPGRRAGVLVRGARARPAGRQTGRSV